MGFKDLHIDAQKSLLDHIKLSETEMIEFAITLLVEAADLNADELRDFIQIKIIRKESHE